MRHTAHRKRRAGGRRGFAPRGGARLLGYTNAASWGEAAPPPGGSYDPLGDPAVVQGRRLQPRPKPRRGEP